MHIDKKLSPIPAFLCNITLALLVYMLCRLIYICENWSLFSSAWDTLSIPKLIRGGLRFDISAVAYTNALYIILFLLPVKSIQQKDWWNTLNKWLFVIVNSLAVIVNLSDAVYSQYTGRRTTATFFHEFSNEGNLAAIFFTELLRHWYLLLAGALLIAILWLLYLKPRNTKTSILNYITFILAFPLTVIAMRGGIINTYRPLALNDANQYVNQPNQGAIVLNTPFSVIRTIGKTTFVDPHYFPPEQLETIYTPLSCNDTTLSSTEFPRKNIVVLIVESFGREYIGYYNKQLDNGTYKGYTPFIDSLLQHSLTWQRTYANGRKSIDAMPSILTSIPMFVEPFYMTGYALNRTNSVASLLTPFGYTSAFFHGANNGSMGFENFAASIGFQHYYGRNEYNSDSCFGGNADFDGTWAIWDEPFLQYYATMLSDMHEPFVTALFTASSHHPFNIPDSYKELYPEEELPIHKCIRYTDNALRQFFATASRQPWFKNTLFVITSDHTNQSNHPLYQTSIGLFSVPILFYDPSGNLPIGVMPGVAQQTDILPTLMGILHYPYPFVAFGQDLLATHPDSTWAVNYSGGIYQLVSRDTLIQYDGHNITNSFDLNSDPLLKKPLPSTNPHTLTLLQAIVQQYMSRMIQDHLTSD